MKSLQNKSILVTGSCGTIGSELVRQLLEEDFRIKKLIALDIDETGIFFQEQRFISENRASFYVQDIKDRNGLVEKCQGVDVIFHTAAMKHVGLCEKSPDQAIQTNILAVENIIYAAKLSCVEVVIFTSSDKAVNPTNVMGTSKLMGERIFTAANSYKSKKTTIFASTRFGNVLGSSGSVIPIFFNQISKGGPVTLTDEKMTRFVMSVSQAVKLVIHSSLIAKGGEVFITKMPVINIKDLALSMIEILSKQNQIDQNIKIELIGSKPGEKLFEELMTSEELNRSIELNDYFIVLPAFREIYKNISYQYSNTITDKVERLYVSNTQKALTVDEIKTFLITNKLISKPNEDSTVRFWPGDK